MLLSLIREPSKNGCTLGELLLDGVHEAWVVEDVVREIPGKPVSEWKVPGKTAIPQGKYRVVLTHSPRFGKVLPELLAVPGFQGIRIHSGNTAADTEGCLIVGAERSPTGVLRSREALLELMAALSGVADEGEQVWIEIRNPA